MSSLTKFSARKDADVEEARTAVFSKNQQIGNLFNKQQEMEKDFELRFSEMKKAQELIREQEMQTFTLSKNSEIG